MTDLKKIFRLLSPEEKNRSVILMLFMLIGALLEVAGIGLILPFIGLVLDPGFINRFQLALYIYQASGVQSHQGFVILACVLLVGFFTVKNLFLFFLCYYQNRFVAQKQIAMSRDLFLAYLHKPYDFFFNVNSADLQRNLHGSVSMVANGVLLNCLGLFSELVVVTAIFSLLLYADPLSSGAALAFTGTALLISHLFSRNRVQRYSRISTSAFASMIKWLNQGIGCIKEIKVLGREKFFLDKYCANSSGCAVATAKHQVLLALPRIYFEIITVTAIVLIVVVHLLKGSDPQKLIATLGLFAMASFRLMPAMNRIATMLTGMRFGMVQLEFIHHDLVDRKPTALETDSGQTGENTTMTLTDRICLHDITYSYPSSGQAVLDSVNLTIPKGSSVGLIGASGSGKSTLVDLLLGLLPPSAGIISVDDTPIAKNLRGWQRNIGYIPQQIYLIDDTVARNIALGIPDSEISTQRIWQVLEIAQLSEFVSSLPGQLDAGIGEQGICLSGGQRQRIGIARALYHDPQVLVLDEATSALDGETERSFMEAINRIGSGKTLIIVAHRLSTLDQCNAIYQLEQGRISSVKENT